MKKLLMVGLSLATLSGLGYAACHGAYCYDDVRATVTQRLSIPVLTGAQISNTNGVAIGDMVICSSCTNAGSTGYAICVATTNAPVATSGNGFVIVNSTNGVVQCK